MVKKTNCIPFEVITSINNLLGLEGRPYIELRNGEYIKTNSYLWNPNIQEEEIMYYVSRKVLLAECQIEKMISSEYTSFQPQEELKQKFLSLFQKHYPDLIDEYVEYLNDLELARKLAYSIPDYPEPKFSEVLSVEVEKIIKELQDNFKPKQYYSKQYFESMKLSLKELPSPLYEEYQVVTKQFAEYSDIPYQRQQEKIAKRKQVQVLLKGKPYKVYGNIIVAPITNQFQLLKKLNTNGANVGLSTEDIIKKLKQYDKKYGITIQNAGFDFVTFSFATIPEDKIALKEDLLAFCPSMEEEINFDLNLLKLWWD